VPAAPPLVRVRAKGRLSRRGSSQRFLRAARAGLPQRWTPSLNFSRRGCSWRVTTHARCCCTALASAPFCAATSRADPSRRPRSANARWGSPCTPSTSFCRRSLPLPRLPAHWPLFCVRLLRYWRMLVRPAAAAPALDVTSGS
jgi:hypothetical protein